MKTACQLTALLLLAALGCTVHAGEYRTLAALEANASGGSSDVANRGYLEEVLRIDSVYAEGPAGNSASLASRVDFARGALAIGGDSNNAYAAADDRYLGANATGVVALRETLSVVLPAGFYADALSVRVPTRVTGAIVTSGPAEGLNFVNGLVRWDLSLFNISGAGGPGTSYTNNTGFVSRTDSTAVDELVDLVAELVPAGTDLAVDTTFEFQLDAQLWVIRNESFSPFAPNSSEVDFASTLRFLAVETPLGLSYDSASGVFLSAVPLPPAIAVLGLPVLLLARAGVRRRAVRPAAA